VQKRQVEFKIITQKIFILLPCLFFIQLSQLFGKDYNAISTSRPGIGNPTSAVPAGLYQFEIGTILTDTSTLSAPMLLRMGFFKKTELQVGYVSKSVTLGVLYGGIHIISGLENSIMLTTSLPIPMNGISYEENNDSLIEFSAYLPISYSFQNGFSVGSQIAGTFYNNEEINPIISYSLVIGSSLDEKTSWFFEADPSEILNLKDDKNNPFSVKYGLTFLSDKNNVQFDLSIGLTFKKKSSMWQTLVEENYVEGGVSFRLPR